MTTTRKAEKKKLRAFGTARKFARGLGLQSESAWRRYCRGEFSDKPRKPDDVPPSPWKAYRCHGWKDMGDWLGTSTAGRDSATRGVHVEKRQTRSGMTE